MKTEITNSARATDIARGHVRGTISGPAVVTGRLAILRLSNDKRNPPRPHSLHVSGVLRIVAQKILFDQALDGNEPEDTEAHEYRVERAVRAEHKSEMRKQHARVNRMAHVRISPCVHKLALRRHETDVPAQAQTRPNYDEQTQNRE